jgi:N4-gp56 family major capsid protein
MAQYTVDLNDPADIKRWSMDLIRETIPKTLAMKWASTSGTTPLHVKTDLSQGKGSTIDFFLRVKGSQAGVKGDEELEGKEEGATFHKDSVTINQLRMGYKSGGRMTEQRVPWNVVDELKDLASDGWSERFDTMFFNLACGYTVETDDRYSGLHSTPTAPTANNIFRPGSASNDQSITKADIFDLELLDKAVNRAKIASPQIRPVKHEGGEYYICVLHPNTVRQLRTSNTKWYGEMRDALKGGSIANNPVFTGALGASNGCVFYESNYVTSGVDESDTSEEADVKRNVLLGAQSICMAFGKGYGPGQWDMVVETKDYKNQTGLAVGAIFGMKKTVFNSVDYGTIVLPSYAPDPS